MIDVFPKDSAEYRNLEILAEKLNERAIDVTYVVGNAYFDFGQNWLWTTIIATRQSGSCDSWQALCPREHELACRGEIDEAFNNYVDDAIQYSHIQFR